MAGTTDAAAGRGRMPCIVPVLLVLGVIGLGLWFLLRDGDADRADVFTGYVVSDNVMMTSPIAGTIATVPVQRGQRIAAGDLLFRVDPTVRAAATDQARAGIAASAAQLQARQAGLEQARADLAGSIASLGRYAAELRRLSAAQAEKPGSVAQIDIERAAAAHESALRQRDAAQTQVSAALSAIGTARAQVDEARAGLTSATRQLDDLAPISPVSGRVEEVMFKPGESVGANAAVVSIIPDGQVKVRFYVPQGQVNAYRPGRSVAVHCDGCRSGLTATVNFVAHEPEYTPPVIYSLDARQKLVFMVEALPAQPQFLLPGQPVDVSPATAAGSSRP